MPLLTRTINTPLAIDIGPGAVNDLAPLLADRRISAGGHVAVAVGPGLGEEIAAAVLFLASDQAAYITGETIGVSGGMGLGG